MKRISEVVQGRKKAPIYFWHIARFYPQLELYHRDKIA